MLISNSAKTSYVLESYFDECTYLTLQFFIKHLQICHISWSALYELLVNNENRESRGKHTLRNTSRASRSVSLPQNSGDMGRA